MRNDIVGHWYLKELGGPFRNFLNSDPEEQKVVAEQLSEKYDRSYFHQTYLEERDDVEKKLYQLFVDRGGKPEIERPIYCFVGCHPTELIYSRKEEYGFKFFRIEDFPSEIISFTYPGSIASIQISEKEEAKAFRSSYHGKLYLKEEIHDVISQYGMPGVDFVPDGSRQHDVLVEAQVWSLDVFDKITEVQDVEVAWLPWITDPPKERRGLKKD